MNIITPCIVAFAVLAGANTPASASPERQTRSISVGISDLDLSDRTDRDILNARIRRAAVDICASLNGAQGFRVAECTRRSIQNARTQRDNQIARHVARLVRADVTPARATL